MVKVKGLITWVCLRTDWLNDQNQILMKFIVKFLQFVPNMHVWIYNRIDSVIHPWRILVLGLSRSPLCGGRRGRRHIFSVQPRINSSILIWPLPRHLHSSRFFTTLAEFPAYLYCTPLGRFAVYFYAKFWAGDRIWVEEVGSSNRCSRSQLHSKCSEISTLQNLSCEMEE